MDDRYSDRSHAGRILGRQLNAYAGRDDVLVLGLPRGGVPVAYEVALSLGAPLDLMLVRKLGVPWQEELAMGAIATGGVRVLNDNIVQELRISQEDIDRITRREQEELQRRQRLYRGNRPAPILADRCIILVDDGLATGASMRVAAAAVRKQNPARLVVAVPVAPSDTIGVLRRDADEVVCPLAPFAFSAVGQWYEDFAQTTDEEVRDLLERAWAAQPAARR